MLKISVFFGVFGFFLFGFLHCDVNKQVFPKEEKNVKEVAVKNRYPLSASDVLSPIIYDKKRIHAEVNIPEENGNEKKNQFHGSHRSGAPHF